MSKTYNVGIVGYGWAATAHIAAINATRQGRVTAIYSSREQNAAELSAKYGSPIKTYRDLDAMLADPEIDVIDITSYPHQHAAQFIAAARAGKQIIVEKPLAIEWNDILAMKRAAAEAGTNVCVCFEVRYSSQFTATKSALDSALIGEVHYAEVDYFHGIGPWCAGYRWNIKRESGGSALLTAGCHALDALLFCMGSDVEEITSYATQSRNADFAPYEYPTTASMLLRFKGGAVGKCAAVVDALQPYYFHTHLVGSEGAILDNKFHSQKIAGLNRDAWSQLSMKLLGSGDVADHPYQYQFQAFFDALDAGRPMERTSLADALRTHRVITAADRSATERRTIRVEEIAAD